MIDCFWKYNLFYIICKHICNAIYLELNLWMNQAWEADINTCCNNYMLVLSFTPWVLLLWCLSYRFLIIPSAWSLLSTHFGRSSIMSLCGWVLLAITIVSYAKVDGWLVCISISSSPSHSLQYLAKNSPLYLAVVIEQFLLLMKRFVLFCNSISL